SEHEDVEIKLVRRGRKQYVLARSQPRRRKERAIRRRQRRGLAKDLRKLQARLAKGKKPGQDLAVCRAPAGALSQGTAVRDPGSDQGKKARLASDLARRAIPRCAGGGWRLCVAEQSQRLDRAGAVGDVYAIGGGGESLPRAQERTASAAGLASI